MTRALFITTDTNEVENHIAAWNAVSGVPATVEVFSYTSIRNDWKFKIAAEAANPDVIFYIGACSGRGLPQLPTLRSLRDIAPVVNLVSDAADKPWPRVLAAYRKAECFDLYVSIDGAEQPEIDLATLTPVDPAPFKMLTAASRDIHCGFSGEIGGRRSEILVPLSASGMLTVRLRARWGGYEDHVRFLCRCRATINISITGSGQSHHVKGRVVEAGWAGCALFEDTESPAGDWLPEDCLVRYGDADDVARLLRVLTEQGIAGYAERLAERVRTLYHPARIYGAILDRIDVDHTLAVEAA
jgi:hypothetical protein